VFVGRRIELATVETLLPQVGAGRTAAVLFIGEPGLGKTELLRELMSQIDLPAVRMHGYEPAREIPFSLAAGLLRELTQVPEAGDRLQDLLFGEAGKRGMDALRIFEAAFRALLNCPPIAIFVDDLQWADRESLALFDYLLTGAAAGGHGLLWIGASRPAEGARALAGSLLSAVGAERFIRIELGPLSRDDGVELVRNIAPDRDVEQAVALWLKAEGSPFWLEALSRGGSGEVNPAALLRSRFRALDADPARVFALLVAAARPLPIADVPELLEWPEARVGSAAAGLVNQALAILESGSLRIAHDLLREAAERQLPEDERRQLHARLAAWLERIAGDELVLLLRALEHRHAAGIDARPLALRIARLPQRRLLGKPGLDALDGVAGNMLGTDSIALQFELASLASELGEWSSALERWAHLTERLPTAAERARASLRAAEAAVRLARPDETYRFAARARSFSPHDSLVMIEADVREGEALRWLQNRVAEAQSRTDRAVTAAQELLATAGGPDGLGEDERRVYTAALRAELDAAIRQGDADRVAKRAQEIGMSAHEPAQVLAAGFDAIFSLIMFEGLAREAEARARPALAEARRLILPIAEVEASHWLGWALHDLGRLQEADAVTRHTVVLAERVGAPARFSLAVVRSNALNVQASRGDWQSSVTGIAEQAKSEPDPHYRLNVQMMRLPLLVRFSTPDRAHLQAELDAMKSDAEAAGCDRCWWQSTLLSAEALARMGDVAPVISALAEWDAARPHPRPGPAARRSYVEALATAIGEADSAVDVFREAARLAAQAGQLHLQLWIELDLASTFARQDREAAVRMLRSVASTAESMGAVSEHRLAIQQLRALGIRAWRPAAKSHDGELSPRETQILNLVAEGASNPEIARSLFLSRKTVERHVTHLLSKLNVRNRIELAALVREDRNLLSGVPSSGHV
jgi:DNA-binding NarL/FixJ family response regulator